MINDLKRKDENKINMEQLVAEFIKIVEEEINAYTILLEALIKQQSLILKGDSELIVRTNAAVKEIMEKTKELGQKRRGNLQNFFQDLKQNENVQFNDIIPYIEKKYAKRLKEFRNVLGILSHKVRTTDDKNQYLLKNSQEFIDKCLCMFASEPETKEVF